MGDYGYSEKFERSQMITTPGVNWTTYFSYVEKEIFDPCTKTFYLMIHGGEHKFRCNECPKYSAVNTQLKLKGDQIV